MGALRGLTGDKARLTAVPSYLPPKAIGDHVTVLEVLSISEKGKIKIQQAKDQVIKKD